jgi:hypothetical protein
MIYPNVFGRLIDPYRRVGITSFGRFAAGKRNVTGDAGFHRVNGDEIARCWVFGANGVSCSVVWILFSVSEFAREANRNFALTDFDWNIEASFASPGLDILKTTVTEAMV